MLDKLTVDDFRSTVGDRFKVDLDGTGTLELEVVEAATHDPEAAITDDSGTRSPFSVEFRGPTEPVLPQRIYHLEHDKVGALEIFVVPIGVDAAGAHYEAVFG